MPVTVTTPVSTRLSQLYDVSIVSPQTGQYLRYNLPTDKWQNTFLNSDIYNYLNTSMTGSNGVLLSKSPSLHTIDVSLSLTALGDATGSVASGNLLLTLANVNTSPQTNTFTKTTVNSKGLVTATSPVTETDIITSLTYSPVNSSGDTMSGLLILSGDPISSNGAATKQYVDNMASGVTVHAACVTSTTAASNLASSFYSNGTSGVGATLVANSNGSIGTVGGYGGISVNDRILVKDQGAALSNGIYVVTNLGSASTQWVLTRAADYDNSPNSEVVAGSTTFIQNGTLTGTQWVMTTAGTINIGSSSIVFTQLSGPNTYTAGTGISIASNVIANTGVLSITAGSNISVTGSTGAITISAANNSPTSTVATNIVGGSAGSIPYQAAASTTTMLSAGTNSQVLVSGTSPSWTNTPSLTGTSFTGIPNSALINSSILVSGGTGISTSGSPVSLGGTLTINNTGVTSAVAGTNISVSSSTGAVTFSVTGIVANATNATNATNSTNVGITDDTTTNATVYPTWVTANTGNLPNKVSSTKLSFNPSTGLLTSTGFAGSGALLTNIPNSALANSSILVSSGPGISITGSPVSLGGTVTVTNSGVTSNVAGTNITVSGATGAVTIGLATAPTITGTNITGIPNSALTNNAITFGATSAALGSTVSGFNAVSIGATTASTGSFTSLTDSGNLTFTGTGNRILGDFSNATLANRVAFQTSTSNSTTSIGILPTGTFAGANFISYSTSDIANSSTMSIGTSTTTAYISSDITGTGTYRPIVFNTSGSTQMILDASGNLGLGITTLTTTGITVSKDVGASATVSVFNATSSTCGTVVLQRARGTAASPTALSSGDIIGKLLFAGATTTSANVNTASIEVNAAEAYTSTTAGSNMTFNTTPIGSVSRTERMRLDGNGMLGIKVAPAAWLSSLAVVELKNNHAIYEGSGSNFNISTNQYVDSGSIAKYATTAFAANINIQKTVGAIGINTYPSNTAGTTMPTPAASFNISQTDCQMVTAAGGLGYGTGAGGTVTQATNKSTPVTLNKPTGQITMNGAALGAGTTVAFTLINSLFAATDVLLVNIAYAAGVGVNYSVRVLANAGTPLIILKNESAGSLSDAVVLNFAIIKGVTA